MKDQLQTIREAVNELHNSFPEKERALTAVAQLEAMVREQKPVANCTNSDAWNCKYCRKATTCEALNDPRNFAAPVAQQPQARDVEDAACWRWLSEHIDVAWSEDGFTRLVRIVSDKHRAMLTASVKRMMAGDWSDAHKANHIADASKMDKQPQAEPDWINGVPHWSPALIAKVKQMSAELDEPEQPQAEAVPPAHVPAGFVLVPEEPGAEIMQAVYGYTVEVDSGGVQTLYPSEYADIYRIIVNAAIAAAKKEAGHE